MNIGCELRERPEGVGEGARFSLPVPDTAPLAAPNSARIARFLSRRDPVLASLIARRGAEPLPHHPSGFPALVRAIVYQQISGAAGASILRRVCAVAGRRTIPPARWFARASTATLRRAGLSPQKIGYLRDLARRVERGQLPFQRFSGMTDEAVEESLTAVHGIGRWTAQMYLLFSLGRPDVLPTTDLGVRKAIRRAYGLTVLPKPRTIERIAHRWRPYRSYGTYYLWRSLSSEVPVGMVSG